MPSPTPVRGSLHHLELWVRDLEAAERTWGRLLTHLGYTVASRWPVGVSYRLGTAYVSIESGPDVDPTGHERTRPGINHVAFRAGTPDDVETLVADAVAHGWTLMFPERHPHAGGPDHYAAYLEDDEGFEVELVAEQPSRPLLLVLSGLPGTGKSTVAQAVARALGAAHVSVDDIEDALLGSGLAPGWTTGVAAYEAAAAAARTSLAAGRPVVVDAVNDSAPARAAWGPHARHVVLHVADAAAHRGRLESRTRDLRHVPEPTWQEVQRREMEPWSTVHDVVDAGRPLDDVIAAVLALLADGGP